MPEAPFITVVGDVMLDRHVTCEVVGISPEDETALKIRPISVEMRAGGAANVANNLMSLGAHVFLVSVVGHDAEAQMLEQQLRTSLGSSVFFIKRADRDTTVKSRYMTGRGRHIVRVDQETVKPISIKNEMALLDAISERLKPSRLIVSDYAKGVITKSFMEKLTSRVDLDTIIVDPKGSDFMKYGRVGIVTPNLAEFQSAGGVDEDRAVRLACAAKIVVVTRGGLGCRTFNIMWHPEENKKLYDRLYMKDKDFNVHTRDVGDPTGCGDSFLAGLAYKLAQGDHLYAACQFANACGACSYDHAGAHVVTEEEVVMEMKKHAV